VPRPAPLDRRTVGPRLGLALAAALVLTAPARAAAQSAECPTRRGTHISIHETNDRRTLVIADAARCFEARSVGDVELTDDDGDVRRLSAGGTLVVSETRGGATRRAEFADRAGAVERRYFENGRAVDAAGAAAWARPLLAQLARESVVGAEARARRILRARGARGVLDEVAEIGSDGAKRVYLTTLVAEGRLSRAELADVARVAGRRLGSDAEKGRVLGAVLGASGDDPAVAAAAVDAAGTIGSDRVKADLLTRLGAPAGGGTEATRAAWLGVARTIGSDAERRRVLLAALEPARAGDALLAADAPRDAFFEAVGGIGSDRERGVVLRALAGRDALPRPALLLLLRSAAGIGSDRERADVLLAVAARPEAMRDADARRAFLDVARGIASSSEYRRVMDAVVR